MLFQPSSAFCFEVSSYVGIIFISREGGRSMKRLIFILAGILAIILVLWEISCHLDSKINSLNSQVVIYNWEPISTWTLENLRRNRNPRVQWAFDSNREPCTRIKREWNNHYDTIPSSTWLTRWGWESSVPLDYSRLRGIREISV